MYVLLFECAISYDLDDSLVLDSYLEKTNYTRALAVQMCEVYHRERYGIFRYAHQLVNSQAST